MKKLSKRKSYLIGCISVALAVANSAKALDQTIPNTTVNATTIYSVSVTGAAGDSPTQPGTACMRIANVAALPAACSNGFIAIPNSNKQLVNAAMANKLTGSQVWLYYFVKPAPEVFHCPYQVYTACGLISLESK
jgi:hypothetical protein